MVEFVFGEVLGLNTTLLDFQTEAHPDKHKGYAQPDLMFRTQNDHFDWDRSEMWSKKWAVGGLSF